MRAARSLVVTVLVAAAALVAPSPARAAPNGPAEKSLDRCQSAVRTEGVKYVSALQKAIGACLGKIASEKLKKNASVAAAVPICTKQFEKIARTDGKSIGDLFAAKVMAKCSPAPDNPHTENDLTGDGFPDVAEPLGAIDVSEICQRYGVLFVDSASDWTSCLAGAQQCAVHGAIAAQFPHAVAWLAELAAAMSPSPARDAVLATKASLEGTYQDGYADGACSVEVSAPGCADALLERNPDQVLDDLRAALAAEDWDAVACNYHPSAHLIDDQGVLIGPQEIVQSLMSLNEFAGGVQPVVVDESAFREGLVRVLFTLDAGWWHIQDGTQTFVVRRGRIVQQTTHGLIVFTGPPPD